MTDEQIARINELARKSKTVGLTDEERVEQANLRSEYLNTIRANMKAQLDSIKIKNPDGSITDVKKRHDAKYGK
ncbi:MAG: DUF896 domain-containing protein [Lachnospiraceae bacterium]|nr:DUF896 domain-containing protein [Lachnospiraceae bacterium]